MIGSSVYLHYWKHSQFVVLDVVRLFVEKDLHQTRLGLRFIFEFIYSYTAEARDRTLAQWLELIVIMFDLKDTEAGSGHHMIQSYAGRGPTKGQAIGLRVVFPKALGQPLKSFAYSKYGQQGALKAAIAHRDGVITGLINSITL